MAASKRTPKRFEVLKEERPRALGWPRDSVGYIARGEKADLIARGVCDESFFPEGRKRVKYGHRVKYAGASLESESVWFWSMRLRAGGWWEIAHYAPSGTWGAACEREFARSGGEPRRRAHPGWRERRYAEEQRSLSELMAKLPTSHEGYRAECERRAKWLESALDFVIEPRGGYSLDQETIEAFADLAAALRRILAEGRTQFRPADREAQIVEIRAKARSADPDFARFMDRLDGGDE